MRSLRLYWYRADKEAWAFMLFFAAVLAAFSLALRMVFAWQDARREAAYEAQRKEIACLARNIYYEARGEPIAGQFAVAEVTMNRRASRLYPRTVCEVVHQKNWDPLRKRYVGAFSWTEFDVLPPPAGNEWLRAQRVAEAVYFTNHIPVARGAMHYHAIHIKPDWAAQKERVAKIGRHVFYR